MNIELGLSWFFKFCPGYNIFAVTLCIVSTVQEDILHIVNFPQIVRAMAHCFRIHMMLSYSLCYCPAISIR